MVSFTNRSPSIDCVPVRCPYHSSPVQTPNDPDLVDSIISGASTPSSHARWLHTGLQYRGMSGVLAASEEQQDELQPALHRLHLCADIFYTIAYHDFVIRSNWT